MLTLEQAREKLRLDNNDNDSIIEPFLQAMPNYIQETTGISIDRQINDSNVKDLVQTLEGFLIQTWYNPEQRDVERLERVTQELIKTLSFIKEP